MLRTPDFLIDEASFGASAQAYGALQSSPAPRAETGRDAARLVEFLSVEDVQNFGVEWADLVLRSLEPNVFLEPSFALSAARHISRVRRPQFLVVWEGAATNSRERLIGLWPLVVPGKIFGASTLQTWVHDFSCSGAPLLDKSQAMFVLAQMFEWLRRRFPHVHALEMAQMAEGGLTCALVEDFARARGLSYEIMTRFQRAALDATSVGVCARDFIATKKKKELQRQLRRLRDFGDVSFGVAQDGEILRDQIEVFMALEAKGWKGRQGSAFLNDPNLPTFLRAMTRTMGRENKCRLYWLAVNGRMIAGNIVLISRGKAYFWKTAYAEDFASASPGVLLTMDMTDRLLQEPLVFAADSCAIPNHPMIDHIWRGRLRIVDVMMAMRPDRAKFFDGAVQRERLRRKLRDGAKSALAHLLSK